MNRLAHHPALCFCRCHASTSSKPPGTRHLCTGSTASPSPTLMWATSVRKASVSRPTVLDRASRPPLSLSLSLSRARARAIKPIQPRAPVAPAPCRSIESCARSAPLLLSFLVAFQARRGPTTRSLLGSRTKDLLSFFTTRCVEEEASKNNEFTFETKKKFTFEVLFYSRFFFHLILKPVRGACKTVQKTRRTSSERCRGRRWARTRARAGGEGRRR